MFVHVFGAEYCSARVSRVGLSTKQPTEPYSDNLLHRTKNTSEPYSDKEIPLRRALRQLLCQLGSQLRIRRKLGLSPLGTVHETVLGHLLTLNPPPQNSEVMDFPLEFLLKGPQTELRTLSQHCEQTLRKLQTNRIINKRAFLN